MGELVSLKVKAIDSDSMRVFVNGGKGKKDRYTILSENALLALRDYWRTYRPKSPEGFLFPGVKNVGHLTVDAVGLAIDKALAKARHRQERNAAYTSSLFRNASA